MENENRLLGSKVSELEAKVKELTDALAEKSAEVERLKRAPPQVEPPKKGCCG